MISFAVSFFVSLILQKFWTFRDSSTHAMHLQAGKYLASSLFGLGINTLLLYILVDHFHLFVYIGQFIAGGLTASITFFISRDIVFQGEKVMIDEI
jgi:putative flippase GtrA